MPKRILVSGAGGFVGHHFLEHVLSVTDWEIVLTDSFRHKGTNDRVAEVIAGHPDWAARIDVITHDLLAPFTTREVHRMGKINYIAAIASDSHVDRSISYPSEFIRNNTEVALNTLDLAREVKPEAVVLVSTDEVYGPVEADDLRGHREWAAILPSNPYSASKAAQEAIAVSYWRTYGVPVVIVNCMNMIGERQDLEKFIPMVTSKVYRGEEVTIHGTEGNIGTRHYLHARNLADAVCFILAKKSPSLFHAHVPSFDVASSDRPDRYNIASPDRIDNLTLAQMIAEDVGRPLKYRLEDFHATRPGHDPHYGLDSSKLRSLGWEMPVPFRVSLRKTVKWTLRNPRWLLEE